MEKKVYTHNEILNQTGISRETLAEWMRWKIVRPAGFTDERDALFSEEALARAAHIQKLVELGYGPDEIQKILKSKPEYVVNTSEFNDVKTRLMAMHNRRKVDKDDPSRPRLRRAPGSGTGPIDEDENGKKPKSDQDERPTLKRRDS